MNVLQSLFRQGWSRVQHGYRGYLVAALSTLAVVLFRQMFWDPWFGESFPLRLFVLPVVAGAWSGGLLPGLFGVVLAATAARSIFGPSPPAPVDWGSTMAFVFIGVLVSSFMESLHRVRRRLEQRQHQLEHEATERHRAEQAERAQHELLIGEIARRREVEAALREREERIRMAVESANIGTWDFNVLTGERRWSDRARDMFGLSHSQDLSDGSFLDLLHPEDRERVGRAIDAALAPEGTGRYEIEYRARRRDGDFRWIVARGQAFFEGVASDRRAVRFIGTVFDITARKEMEQSLKDADRRKDEFLATLAHELRNPLTPISNALQLLPLVEGNREETDHLRTMMQRQMRQLTRLIDDLMDVSRITRGKIELRRQPLDLGALLAGAIESIQPAIDAQSQHLSVVLPPDSIFVNGDVARLVQVFGNIISNAVKYTGTGGDICVGAAVDAGQALVTVSDNGPGIPREMLREIFEMFRQVDGTITRAHGGLGIGLTLVKQLVELHGGSVEANSEGPGQGSQFLVRLPLAEAPSGSRAPPAQVRSVRRLPQRRVLVVDDVQASAKTLAVMLRGMGQEVWAVHDGRSAIESALSLHPDAVFLDIAMPQMNGYEVARAMRAHPELAHTLLIALTGYGQEEDRRRAFEAGFDHHMVKPPSIDGLEDVLARLTSSDNGAAADLAGR